MNRLAAFFRLVSLLTLAGFVFGNASVFARGPQTAHIDTSIWPIAVAELPPEARDTLILIKKGGPFPYPRKDGSIFGNFEGRLPAQRRGYYREYTVPTPGERDRGARRIIAGSPRSDNVMSSGEYYYTNDHYRSFRRIEEGP